jgi:hypothetical protein
MKNDLRDQMNAYVSISKFFAFWQADRYRVVTRDHVRRNLHLLDEVDGGGWFDTENEAWTWVWDQVEDLS